MPSLLLSSRFSEDSQALRQAAQKAGWETLRIDGSAVPDWFEPPDDQVAFFCTAPRVFQFADELGRRMLGCNSDWTPGLPEQFLKRELRQVSVNAVLSEPRADTVFAKHAVSKVLEAGLFTHAELSAAVGSLPPAACLHIGEPVRWLTEYRCFVVENQVVTTSPYKRGELVFSAAGDLLGATDSEMTDAVQFAESVLTSGEIECPPAFVLDVGQIEGRGWAVIEVNECWASGIYSCDPAAVLSCLLKGVSVIYSVDKLV